MGDDLVVVGRLGGVHGLRGELRLIPETDFPERLRAGRRVLLVPRAGGPPRPSAIARVTPLPRGAWLLAAEGLHGPEEAAPFAGGLLCVRASDLPPLPAGTYYHHQLAGLRVLAADGREVGHVRRVDARPANDVFVVARPDGRELLVPAAHAAVEAIDLAAGVLRLRPLPGLLEE